MSAPVICFGQQPCGFFPRRFLAAKIATARKLQQEIGGEIVFFCHDSDHDARETQVVLRHRKGGAEQTLNFTFENKVQRKWSPLALKRVPAGWQAGVVRQLPAYVDKELVEVVKGAQGATAAEFCLDCYRRQGLLEGVRVVRSSAESFRTAACEITDFFVDVPYENEVVRGRWAGDGKVRLHEGGESFLEIPAGSFGKAQISPTRDTRLRWMQSVLHCTHYICGAGEQAYLHPEEAPEITFVPRDAIDRSDEAFTEFLRQ